MELQHKDCVVSFENKCLTLENSYLKRVVDFSEGLPKTTSFINQKTGIEFIHAEVAVTDIALCGLTHWDNIEFQIESTDVKLVQDGIFDSEHLCVEVVLYEPGQRLRIRRLYMLYPELPVTSAQYAVTSGVTPGVFWNDRVKVHHARRNYPPQENRVEGLTLADSFKPYRAVEFRAITDFYNEQVIERDAGGVEAVGNILLCGDFSRENGLFILQEAPTSGERRDQEPYDFRFDGNFVASCGSGFCPWDYQEDHEMLGFRHTVGFFEGDFEMSLKKYQQVRFPDCDYQVMANPWAVHDFPSRVTEQFLIDEIRAAAKLGATEYQIDDGWQVKRVLTVMNAYNEYPELKDWSVHPELLPDGLQPLVDVANEVGIELALWVAPTFTREYRDWREFADMLMDFYEKYNIKIFKIDSVRLRSREAYENFYNMIHSLRERSNGDIVFNFDTTNGQRTGYFTFLEYGNIFLENRYVNRQGGLGYHPESTLHNAWQLSRYSRLQKFQVEIADPGTIRHEFYEHSEIHRSAPDVYPPEYWAAVAMFANPLLWLGPSEISSGTMQTYRKVIDLHLAHRDEIFKGIICPIGTPPDGKSITGFQSHNTGTNTGYVIVYRELDAPASADIELKFLVDSKVVFESVSDASAPITIEQGGKVKFELPEPASFRLYRYGITD
jgi:alpha-galactosidase